MRYVEFPASQAKPFAELTSRVQTQGRAMDWSQKTAKAEEGDTLRYCTRATTLIPTDGIVRKTELTATQGAKTDVEKARKPYDWIVANTYRDPKARDVALPNSRREKPGFFMYPIAENAGGRFDSYAPDDFKYQITAREIKA